MKNQLCVMLLLTFTCWISPFAICQEAGKEQILNVDKRLDRTITINAKGIELNVLLRRLSNEEISITASKECGLQKLHISIKNRPIRKIMNDLAELLPGTWDKDAKGYTLYRNLKRIKQRDDWWEQFLTLRKKYIEAHKDRVVHALKDGKLPHDFEFRPTTVAGERETLRNMYAMVAEFPDGQLREIANSLNELPFYSSERRIFSTRDIEGAACFPYSSLKEDYRNLIATLVNSKANASGAVPSLNGAYIYFTVGLNTVFGGIIFKDGSILPSIFSKNISTPLGELEPFLFATSLNHAWLPSSIARFPAEKQKEWAKMLIAQQTAFWENPIKVDPPSQPFPRFLNPIRTDVIEWLADKGNMEFIADYYTTPGVPLKQEEKDRKLEDTLPNELAKQAALHDFSWKGQDGLYLIRSNRWYRNDRIEIPNETIIMLLRSSFVNSNNQKIETRLKNFLDSQAALVSNLSLYQLFDSLPHIDFVLFEDQIKPSQTTAPSNKITPPSPRFPYRLAIQLIQPHYHLLRWYAKLSAEKRNSLIADKLAYHTLTPEQKELALFLAPTLRASLSSGLEERRILLGLSDINNGSKEHYVNGLKLKINILP